MECSGPKILRTHEHPCHDKALYKFYGYSYRFRRTCVQTCLGDGEASGDGLSVAVGNGIGSWMRNTLLSVSCISTLSR